MPLFLRDYSLAIGKANDAILIQDLQFTFEVTRTLESDANSCKLKIYNLSPSSRVKLDPVDQVVVLQAGYEGDLKTLFTGTTIQTFHVREGHDVVTEVICKDGQVNLREARTNRGFPPGSTVEGILRTLVTSDLKLALGEVIGDGLGKIYQNGHTIDGPTKKAIDVITGYAQLQWSIQDNTVDIIGKNTSSKESVILLSPSTGLIGSPQRYDGAKDQLAGVKVPESKLALPTTGITLKTLLNGAIRPGRPVKVESEFINGIYKATKVTHSGDYRGQQWETHIEGDLLGNA